MKKHIIILILCIISINILFAQRRSVSKHNVSFYGGFGLSTLQYQVEGGNQKFGIGGNAGISYTHMLSSQWGINTGVEASFLNTQCNMNTLISERLENGSEGEFIFKATHTDYNETQKVSYFSIPVTILYKTQTPTAFYGIAGAKLGFPINCK